MYKQIIIARKDLSMSSGKLAAQVSHGSMAFLSWFIRNNADLDGHIDGYIDEDILHNWIEGEFTKCVLQAKNKNQLLKAKTMAKELGMVEGKDFWLIRDNCHTELEPEEDGRTLTVIGFRPMDSEIIDQIGRKNIKMANRLLLESDVIRAVDKHTTNDRLDNDISCILEEVKSPNNLKVENKRVQRRKREFLFENENLDLERRGNRYYLSLYDKDGKFQREVTIDIQDDYNVELGNCK